VCITMLNLPPTLFQELHGEGLGGSGQHPAGN
jgi:hypothetical protein